MRVTQKKQIGLILTFTLLMVISACQSVTPSPTLIPNWGLKDHIYPPTIQGYVDEVHLDQTTTPTLLSPSVTPTLIQVPQVTHWKTYTSENFGVSLNYPEYWEFDNSGAAVYSGPDGFFQITAAGSAVPTARGLCEDYTQRPLSWKLMDYGSNPSMEILQVDDQPDITITVNGNECIPNSQTHDSVVIP